MDPLAFRGAEHHHTVNCASELSGHLTQVGHIGHAVFHPGRTQTPVARRFQENEIAGEVFVGRRAEVARVLADLAPDAGGRVSVIAGMGGVGKTALARRVAASAQEWFPGGVIWVDLPGDGEPVTAGPLVRAIGEQGGDFGRVLDDLADRGRAVLLVLDNVVTGVQARDLLPRRGPHRTLVTTRETPDLPHSRRLELPVLDPTASRTLLSQITGAQATNELASVCAGLPLALHIAAALLSDEPGLPAHELARQLLAAPGVEGYTAGERALAPVFDQSWQRLLRHSPEQARLLRLLCLVPEPEISTETAAHLANHTVDQVRVDLRSLRHAHLLQSTGLDRWSLHPLIRAHILTRAVPGLTSTHLHTAARRLIFYKRDDSRQARMGASPSRGESCGQGGPVQLGVGGRLHRGRE